MSSFLQVAQLVDSAFPTGAFSHSFGLETMLQEQRIMSIPAYISWLEQYISGGVAPLEGTGVCWSWMYADMYLQQEKKAEAKQNLLKLSRRLTASKLAMESRAGVSKIGKRYLHTVKAVYPHSGLDHYEQWIKDGEGDANAAIVHGWICCYLKVPLETAVLSYLFQSLNSMIQNTIRMWSLGQTDAQRVLAITFPLLEREAAAIAAHALLPEKMFNANVMQEIASMRHETLYSRLFMS